MLIERALRPRSEYWIIEISNLFFNIPRLGDINFML